MHRAKRFLLGLLVVAFALLVATPQAEALYGLKKWYLGVFDENGQIITETVTVNVFTADSTTNATIYSDDKATAKSNPWDITDGKVEFYSSATTLDIQTNYGARGAIVMGVTEISTHRLVLALEPVGFQKVMAFDVGEFIIHEITDRATDATSIDQLDESTVPGLEYDNNGIAIVWSDGEDTPTEVRFRVPYDYQSGGAFRGVFDRSSVTETTSVDYEVYVNEEGTAWDAAVTDQTPVAVGSDPGSPDEVDLAVTTDFAALEAGDLVTLRIWRDDTTDTGTADLELYYLEFYYNAKQ